MWKTMWKPYVPIVFDVNNFVENSKTYLQKNFSYVENWDINSLLTYFSHLYVDISLGYSVSKVSSFVCKHFFNKRIFLKNYSNHLTAIICHLTICFSHFPQFFLYLYCSELLFQFWSMRVLLLCGLFCQTPPLS